MTFSDQINVIHENQDFRISVWLIHSVESMDSMESMAMESEVKYIRWW